MKKVSIVGFGRFGRTLHRLIRDDFDITIYTRKKTVDDSMVPSKNTKITSDVEDIYKSNIVFFAVPIDEFENVISSHQKYFREDHILVDVLSVKIYPKLIFDKYLKNTKVQAILTHPMFGPDSSKSGFYGLPLIVDRYKSSSDNYEYLMNYFACKGLKVIEMDAKTHDKIAANSQGVTHFVGRLLESYGLKSSGIDSQGTKKLLEIKEQTCNDTWQLFTNLQHYNPYTSKMRIRLGEKFDDLYNKLLPSNISGESIVFGIQGGQGSFNEEAVNHYISKSGIKKYKIKYLYTSTSVLKALHAGEIDRGQFAIHNSAGGIVDESIYAMSDYKFRIVSKFAIKISHALMVPKGVNMSEITTIMTHPQVLAQCKNNLSKKYPHLLQTSGQGKHIDHALVAKDMGSGKLPRSIAVMGSKILASVYDLEIVEENLQDLKENYTTFLQVSRR